MYLMPKSMNGLVNDALLPLKLMVPQPVINRIPWLTTNEDIRMAAVLRFIPADANCLDVGCGKNVLMQKHRARGGSGTGVDVYPWEGVDVVVEDTAKLPFPDGSFDCISFVACLNHIPNRQDVLRECHRLLKPEGILIITMLSPFLSRIWHARAERWDADQHERGMRDGEVYGITKKMIESLTRIAGFKISGHHVFSWCLNRLYVAQKVI